MLHVLLACALIIKLTGGRDGGFGEEGIRGGREWNEIRERYCVNGLFFVLA